MTDATREPGQTPKTGKSGRYSFKSEGRRQHMLRLRAEGKAASTGPGYKHGIRGLEERLRRGLEPGGPLAALHAERRAAYIADLGGEGNMSNMEAGICDRLADLDLVRGLLNAQRETAKRMTAANLLNHVVGVTRNCLAYVQAVKAIGPGRRQKPTDKTIVVRRYAADPEAAKPDDGPGEGQAEVAREEG